MYEAWLQEFSANATVVSETRLSAKLVFVTTRFGLGQALKAEILRDHRAPGEKFGLSGHARLGRHLLVESILEDSLRCFKLVARLQIHPESSGVSKVPA
jgi:hypothetical protein